jgi:uncharacterized protein (DUF305 family)
VSPPRGLTLVALIAALCFLAGAIGWTLAGDEPPSQDSADVGFLYDMRAHHEQAVYLSQVELAEGDDDHIKVFAEEIHRFQSYEIGAMDQMLIEWGYRPENRPEQAMAWMGHPVDVDAMPGLATEEEIDRLEAGPDTDDVFVALMVDHHAAGAAMAEAAAEEVDDPGVRALAEAMARNQRAEIGEMLGASGLEQVPEGIEIEYPLEADGGSAGSGGADGDDHGHEGGG